MPLGTMRRYTHIPEGFKILWPPLRRISVQRGGKNREQMPSGDLAAKRVSARVPTRKGRILNALCAEQEENFAAWHLRTIFGGS